MNKITGIKFIWVGRGFGNALILAHLTKICNDNGINAVFSDHRKTKGLVDVPFYNSKLHKDYFIHTWMGIRNTYQRKNCDEPVIIQYIKNVEKLTGEKIELAKGCYHNYDPLSHGHDHNHGDYSYYHDHSQHHDHSYIPVTFHDSPDIPAFDVVMNTATGPWAPYRDWPYFDELKQLFNANGISFIDLNKNKMFGHRCLNYVKNARLYLGLETGMSHYVSRFANSKALILQSGFCPFIYWAYPYNYDCLKVDVNCERRPCFINREDMAKGIKCDNRCMKQMTAEMVFEAVRRRL